MLLFTDYTDFWNFNFKINFSCRLFWKTESMRNISKLDSNNIIFKCLDATCIVYKYYVYLYSMKKKHGLRIFIENVNRILTVFKLFGVVEKEYYLLARMSLAC